MNTKKTVKYTLALILGTFVMLFSQNVLSQGKSGLVISQMMISNDPAGAKGIEIWNNTGSIIDFSTTNMVVNYLCAGQNAATLTNGVLPHGKVWIVGSSPLITASSSQTDYAGGTDSGYSLFSGINQVRVQLYLGGELMDMTANCNENGPWTNTGITTLPSQKSNIQLKSQVCLGSYIGFTNATIVDRFETVSTGGGTVGFGIAPSGGCPMWKGSISSNWFNAGNWVPSGVPGSGDKILIPSPSVGVNHYPVLTDFWSYTVTLSNNQEMSLAKGAQFTIGYDGKFINNGVINIRSGATLVHEEYSLPSSGSGTWNVSQAIEGTGITSSIVGRMYYMGSPVNNAISGIITSPLYSSPGRLFKHDEANIATANGWSPEITWNNEVLNVAKGYAVIVPTNRSVHFSGSQINQGQINSGSLSRTGTTSIYRGFHLLSNPYPAYLDWDLAYINSNSSLEPTIWYQSKLGASNPVFDTYSATSGVVVNNSGIASFNEYIPPMQGFWVRVKTDGTNGGTTFYDHMTSHQPAGSAIRAHSHPVLLRMNIEDGSISDQTVVYFSENAENTYENYDSEKMMSNGISQVYSVVDGKNLVINGFKYTSEPKAVPLIVKINTTKEYTLVAKELIVENGTVYLEDKSTQTMQDLSIHDTYTFFAKEGMAADRFVLHFQPQGSLAIPVTTLVEISVYSDKMGHVIVNLNENAAVGDKITIVDAAGRIIKEHLISDAKTELQLNGNKGLYFVQVSNGNAFTSKKIIIAQ